MVAATLQPTTDFNWSTLSLLLQSPIAYHRVFAHIGGGATAGLFLSQAFYWTPRTKNPDGWFYKTSAEWEQETGLTRWEQETARKQLIKRGLIVEKKQGLPCKLFFRIVKEQLISAITSLKTAETSQNQQFEEKPHTRMRETHKLDRGKPSNLIEEKPQTGEAENPLPVGVTDAKFLPEITSKITSENTYKEQVCVGLEKTLDEDRKCDQQKFYDHEHEINQDPIPEPLTTLLEETNQDPTPESCTTPLDDVETSQNDETGHEGQGSAAPRDKTLQKTSQKEKKWKCPGNDAEKAAFLKWKGELLAVKYKRCEPVEGRTAALAWANKDPEAADLLWQDWQKWQKQKVQEAANPNTAIADTVPEFRRMDKQEHAAVLDKFINHTKQEFLKLCWWHKYWLEFASRQFRLRQELIPGLTAEIIQKIKD